MKYLKNLPPAPQDSLYKIIIIYHPTYLSLLGASTWDQLYRFLLVTKQMVSSEFHTGEHKILGYLRLRIQWQFFIATISNNGGTGTVHIGGKQSWK